MPVYILSPYITSGAPEALHQLCHHLNIMGIDSYLVYFDKQHESGYPLLYQDMYPNLQEAKEIEDDSIVIFFEIMKYTIVEKLYAVKNCTYMLWWLSINNAIMYQTIETNLENPSIIHLFHGEFIKQYVCPFFTQNQRWYYLHDYIDTDVFHPEKDHKEDIIAYNPQKDFISGPLLIPKGYRTLPLIDLDRKHLIHTLQNCKIYLDLGAHNGRDRIPREAALLGCVVITNQFGSAKYEEDIGIPPECKVSNEQEAYALLDNVLDKYPYYYDAQKEYRDSLLTDKRRFQDQIRHILLDYLYARNALTVHIKSVEYFTEILRYKHSCIDSTLTHFFQILKGVSSITEMGGENRMFTDLLLYVLSLQTSTHKKYICVHPQKFIELEIYKHVFSQGDLTCHQLTQDYLVEIPPTDVLFLHTWHNYGQQKRELQKHASSVRKYIVCTHTVLDGTEGESVRLGLDIEAESTLTGYTIGEIKTGVRKAIDEFLQENTSWKKIADVTHDGGFIVLQNTKPLV